MKVIINPSLGGSESGSISGSLIEKNYNFKCIFNHIGMEKDWDEIILCCINGDLKIKMVSFTKENFPINLCARQQGGNSGKNDDFMCANGHKLLEHENAHILI